MNQIKVKPQGQTYLVVQCISATGDVLETKHFAPGQYMDVSIPDGGKLEVYDKATFDAMVNSDGPDA
jgi:hypothetical protein